MLIENDEAGFKAALVAMSNTIPKEMVARYQKRAFDEWGENDESVTIALCEAACDYIQLLANVYTEVSRGTNSSIHVNGKIQKRQKAKKG